MNKTLALLLLFVMLFAFTYTAYGQTGTNSLIQKVEQHEKDKGESLKDVVDQTGSNIVEFIRSVFLVAAVIFVIWAGFMFLGSGGNHDKIAVAKKALAGFVICMICVFAAERIVGGIIGVLGVK